MLCLASEDAGTPFLVLFEISGEGGLEDFAEHFLLLSA